MKIEWTKGKKLFLVMIVSTIGIYIFSTISDIILFNHGVPNIDYESFLGENYWIYILFGLLAIISTFSFAFASYELVKDFIKARGVKQHG
jgi:hypothetical protein